MKEMKTKQGKEKLCKFYQCCSFKHFTLQSIIFIMYLLAVYLMMLSVTQNI